MVEKLYYLLEEITMIVCLFGLYGKKVKGDILTTVVLVMNMFIFSLTQTGYIGEIYPVLALVMLFVYCLYEFRESIKLTMANFFLCIILITILQLISVFPMLVIRQFITDDACMLLIVNIMILGFVIIVKGKLGYISGYISNNKFLSILPIFLCFIEILVLLVQFKKYKILKFDMYFMITTFTLLVICLIQKWYESRAEAELKSHELMVVSMYNNTFDKLIDDIRKRQHNIKNHFNAIFSLHYTCSSYKELVECQQKYCEYIINTGRFDKLLTINMPVLAGFLYSKFHTIEENGVNIDYIVELNAKELNVPMYEMITILGILLDNAKERAELLETKNKIVKVEIVEDDSYIYFKIKNINDYMKINDIFMFFEKGYSTKGENRGMGLSIIKQKSLEYGFDILVENEKDKECNWIVFQVLIKK